MTSATMPSRGATWMALRLAAPGTGRPNPRGATRMALALIGPLAVGLAIGRPVLGMIAALAAFFTALIEPVGGYRAHVTVYLVMVPVNAAIAALASAVAGTVWQAGLAGLAVGVASGILVGSTSRVAVAGPFPLFLFVVVQGTAPQPALWAASAAAATGALWVALAAIALLPFAPFAPSEAHLAEGWKAIALLARNPRSDRHHAMALSALEATRLNLIATPGRSSRWRRRRRQLWASTLQAEGAMLSIITLGASGDAAAAQHLLAAGDVFAQGVGRHCIWRRTRPDPTALLRAADDFVAGVQSRAAGMPDPRDAAVALAPSRSAQRLVSRLIAGLDALDDADPAAPAIPDRTPPAVLAPLRASARRGSPGLRHGLRLGIGAGGLMAIIGAWDGSLFDLTTHGPWVTITLVDVLAPSLGASLQRTSQRALGTAVGGILAALLIWLLGDPWLVAIAAIALGTTAAFIRFINYAWFMALFTPLVLLVASTAAPMGPDIAVQRTVATLIGCGLGFLLAIFVLPTRQGPDLPGALARAVDAVADDVDAAVAAARQGASMEALVPAHRAAMQAASDALQVFDGVAIESLARRRARSPVAEMELATIALVERAVILGARLPGTARVIPGTLPAAQALEASLREIADAIRHQRPPSTHRDLTSALDPAWRASGDAAATGASDPVADGVIDGLAGMIGATTALAAATGRWVAAERPTA